nr:immunoglobulin heavy chain junction region [Mus musculus]MBK4188557.1 immunoglobulin heavy chain junction region [Mus musculus]MBK4188558.1 immunoglobulin heavy chain junction region [Mus musculus]MBK4188559.1 immunoglobulin heavy chain junction region [Mus musculus]
CARWGNPYWYFDVW